MSYKIEFEFLEDLKNMNEFTDSQFRQALKFELGLICEMPVTNPLTNVDIFAYINPKTFKMELIKL